MMVTGWGLRMSLPYEYELSQNAVIESKLNLNFKCIKDTLIYMDRGNHVEVHNTYCSVICIITTCTWLVACTQYRCAGSLKIIHT